MNANEFTTGWKHFLDCIPFGKAALDGEAIQFMNEMPGKIIHTCNSHDKLVEACETILEAVHDTDTDGLSRQDYIAKAAKAAIDKAKKGE